MFFKHIRSQELSLLDIHQSYKVKKKAKQIAKTFKDVNDNVVYIEARETRFETGEDIVSVEVSFK